MKVDAARGGDVLIQLGLDPSAWHEPPYSEVAGREVFFNDIHGDVLVWATLERQLVRKGNALYYIWHPALKSAAGDAQLVAET